MAAVVGRDAALFLIEYSDGLTAALLHGQGEGNLIQGWAYAARVVGEGGVQGGVQATCFNGSAAPNYAGFSYMGLNIEQMFESKQGEPKPRSTDKNRPTQLTQTLRPDLAQPSGRSSERCS